MQYIFVHFVHSRVSYILYTIKRTYVQLYVRGTFVNWTLGARPVSFIRGRFWLRDRDKSFMVRADFFKKFFSDKANMAENLKVYLQEFASISIRRR